MNTKWNDYVLKKMTIQYLIHGTINVNDEQLRSFGYNPHRMTKGDIESEMKSMMITYLMRKL